MQSVLDLCKFEEEKPKKMVEKEVVNMEKINKT
jgi:hypothetical protein